MFLLFWLIYCTDDFLYFCIVACRYLETGKFSRTVSNMRWKRKKIFPHLRSQIFISINNVSFNQAIIQLFMRFFVTTRINYQGWGRGYQLKPKATTNKTWKHKTKCNNCFIIHEKCTALDMITHDFECSWHDCCIIWSYMRSVVASMLTCSTPERVVLVWALAGDIMLCSWARHFTLTVPLST